MQNLKAKEKSDLIYEFAILMQPLEELARAQQQPSLNDFRIAIAKVQGGDHAWRQLVGQFTTFATDIRFNQEFEDISHVPERCMRTLNKLINNPNDDQNRLKTRAESVVANSRRRFFEYIERIPIEWEPVVFEANTPFTPYLRIEVVPGNRTGS